MQVRADLTLTCDVVDDGDGALLEHSAGVAVDRVTRTVHKTVAEIRPECAVARVPV